MLTHDAALPFVGTMQSLYRFRTIRYNFRCLATLLYRYSAYARPFALIEQLVGYPASPRGGLFLMPYGVTY